MTATTPSRHAERREHRGVLARLGHHAVVGGDDHQVQVDPGRARDHRAHEALVAGHVDDRQPAPRRQRERRVAELDRDPARLLLGQAVGVDAGQRGDERGLAVVDVAGGAEGERASCLARGAYGGGRLLGLLVGERARVEQQPPVGDPRPTSGGSPARRRRRPARRSIATAGPGSSSSGSAPPPTFAVARDDLAAAAVGQPARAGLERLGAGLEHRPARALGARELGVAVEARASPPARRATACRCAPRAPAGGAGTPRSPSCVPTIRPRLRAAEQLVAR